MFHTIDEKHTQGIVIDAFSAFGTHLSGATVDESPSKVSFSQSVSVHGFHLKIGVQLAILVTDDHPVIRNGLRGRGT